MDLCDDIIIHVANFLTLDDVINVCVTNKYMYKLLLQTFYTRKKEFTLQMSECNKYLTELINKYQTYVQHYYYNYHKIYYFYVLTFFWAGVYKNNFIKT